MISEELGAQMLAALGELADMDGPVVMEIEAAENRQSVNTPPSLSTSTVTHRVHPYAPKRSSPLRLSMMLPGTEDDVNGQGEVVVAMTRSNSQDSTHSTSSSSTNSDPAHQHWRVTLAALRALGGASPGSTEDAAATSRAG